MTPTQAWLYLLPPRSPWPSAQKKKEEKRRKQTLEELGTRHYSPRAESFLVLMILAANSSPVDFWTHRRTMEKAPLWTKQRHGYLFLQGDLLRLHPSLGHLSVKLKTRSVMDHTLGKKKKLFFFFSYRLPIVADQPDGGTIFSLSCV